MDVDTLSTVLSVKVSWLTIVSEQLQTTLSLATQSQRTNIAFRFQSGENECPEVGTERNHQVVGAVRFFRFSRASPSTEWRPRFPSRSSHPALTGNVQPGLDACSRRGAFQLTDDHSMPSSEQFAVGGVSTVRGLPEGARMGDTGYLVSAELSYPIMQKVQGVMFIDSWCRISPQGKRRLC